MAVNEYLYVDRQRLESYFQQVSREPKRVKLPSWKAAFSIAGPSVEGSQQSTLQPFTEHEMIQLVVAAIKPAPRVSAQRDPHTGSWLCDTFIRETHSACRAVIPRLPSVGTQNAHLGPIAIWICDSMNDDGRDKYTYLIEDYPRDDTERIGGSSSYTSFGMLLEALSNSKEDDYITSRIPELATEDRDSDYRIFSITQQQAAAVEEAEGKVQSSALLELLESVQAGIATPEEVRNIPHSTDPFSTSDKYITFFIYERERRWIVLISRESKETASMKELRVIRRRDQEVGRRFIIRPHQVIGELGGRIGSVRSIETVFRVRMVDRVKSMDGSLEAPATVVFGYPIVIAEYPCSFH